MDASSAAAPPTHSPGTPALKPFIKGERRYPCGYPGCKWIFTRSNHVLRHHQRVHPGYRSSQYGNKGGSGSNGNSGTTTSPSTNSLSPPSATTTTVNSGNPPPLPTIKIPRSMISSSSSSAPSSSSATPSPSVHKVQSSNSPSRSLLQGGSLSGAMINQKRPKVVDGVRTPMSSHKPIAVKPPPPSSPKEDTTSQQQQTLLLAHLLTALQQQIASSSIGGGSTSAASLLSALEQQVLLTSLLSGNGGDVGGLLSSLTQPPTPSPQVQSGRRTAHHPITQERVVSQGLHHHVVSSSIPRGGPVIVEDSEGEGEDNIVNLSLKSPSNKRFKSASPRNPPVILEDPSTAAQFMEEQQASLVEEKEDFDSMSPPLEPLEPEVVLEVDDSHVWDPEVQDAVTPAPSPFARVGQNSGNDVLTSGGSKRPYACDFPGCRWSFKRQYHLDRHLLTHKAGGGGSNGINVNNKRPFSDEEEVISGGVEEGDSDVEVVPIKEERNKQPVQPVVQQQQQRKLSAAGAVAPPSSTVTSAPSNLTRTPTASTSSLSTPVMINAIQSSPSQGKQQLRQNQNQSQLPATATVQGPIKGSFTCNYPGCGIKCQSQSSFEAHVYLTHIVMNARGRERERNRANAGISKTPNGGNTASPGRAASAHRNNSLINSPFYLELQSKMKQKMMEQKQAKERMRARQEELQKRYILQQQEERRQRLLAQQQLHQRQKNLMSTNLMLGEVGSSESESERVSSTVRDSHQGNGHHGGMGNQEVSTTVVNGGGRDDESSDQSATQQLSFLASILSAVSRQQNQKISSNNNYPVQSPVPQRNGPRTSPTVEIPESLSQLERVLSGGGQKTKPMMKMTSNQPSASNNNLTNSNVVKCPPGVRTSSESLSFLASLAQKNSQQQQQMQQPFTFLDNSATTLLEGNGNGSSGQHHGSEGTGGGKALFACDIEGCDKKFGRNCELTRHKLNHMDIWPFSCDHPGCGRRFKRKDVFKNHLRTHVKECPSSTSLMSHMSSSNSSPATSSLSSPVG